LAKEYCLKQKYFAARKTGGEEREMRGMLRIGFVGLAAAAILTFSSAPALASFILVHTSTEEYYDSGGTLINGCDGEGCPGGGTTSYGDISGTVRWEVKERVWYDVTIQQTKISYTVFNDAYAGQLITSFHVPTGGATVLDVTAPTDWTYTHSGDMVWWEADDPTPSGAGIAELHSLDTMIITYDGVLPIIFGGPVLVDLDGDPPFTMSDWVVSTVPEPASAAALLLTTAFLLRRRARG
jgi:hypothetical protein